MPLLIVVVCALAPAGAAAQGRQTFATAILELTRALDGAHGDEGPRVLASIAAMTRGLAEWDRDLERLEEQAAAATGTAAPHEAARFGARLGLAYAERGRFADAFAAFDRAAALDPREPAPHVFRGLVEMTRDPAAAAAAFRRAWELDRGDPVKAYWLVESAHRAGDADGAVPALDTLSAAYRLIAGGASKPSRPFIETGLFLDDATAVPVFPLVAYQEGYARLAAREYDRAVAALQAAAAADPLVSDAALRLGPAVRGAAELREGRTLEAIAALERAFDLASSSSEVHRVLGVAYRAAGRVEESLLRLEYAIRLHPHNERAQIERIALLEDMGDHVRTRRALDDAIAALPASGALHWMSAVLARRLDDEAELLRQLDAIPTGSMLIARGLVWAAAGRVHLSLMQAHAALQPFRDAVLASPNNARAHLDLGELYRTEGMPAPALGSFVAALLIAPDVVDAHTAVGHIHLSTDRPGEAATAFRRAVALQPDHPDAQYGLARALQRLGRPDEAQPHFAAFTALARQRAADLRANYELFGLKREAAIHHDEGRYDEAVRAWRAAVARQPDDAGNHVALGEALAAAGQVDAAIEELERAAGLDASADVYRRLAELYAARGRAGESARARAEYERRQAEAFRRRTASR